MQRRPAVVVFAENQIRIVFEQRLDLFQVAILGRVMNLAAEGEAAPSQRDQRDQMTAARPGIGEWQSRLKKECLLFIIATIGWLLHR